jgi:hypothetical protein
MADTAAQRINNEGDILGEGKYQGKLFSFLLTHLSGAPETFDAIISNTGSVSATTAHNLDP